MFCYRVEAERDKTSSREHGIYTHSMKYREWQGISRRNPNPSLNGVYAVIDRKGKRIGEIVYRKGTVILRRRMRQRAGNGLSNTYNYTYKYIDTA